jgi:glyoxylase-like metal-dependent hydrolase (beta-lactamase superfamily II)
MGEKVDVPLIAWLIRGNGITMVMDTGPGLRGDAHLHQRIEFHDDGIVELLKAAGTDADEVDVLVLSHLHFDHCGAISAFPNARIVVRDRELRAAIAPPPTYHEVYGIEAPGPVWMPFRSRMEVISQEMDIVPGIHAVDLPGHCPGLIGLRVDTPEGPILLASDSCPQMVNWQRRIAPGAYWNVEDCFRSFDRIADLDVKLVLPGHDFEVFSTDFGRAGL